jgi:4-hydroxy-tetrahydrodipicolinate reductase
MSVTAAPRPIRAVLIGAGGRMGRAILAAAAEFPALTFIGAIASPDSALLGRDAGVSGASSPGQLMITSELAAVLDRAEVVIDFSHGEATRAHLHACRAAGKALLLGTTGYPAALEAEFAAAAREMALLVAANTSLGVTLLLELATRAAAALPGFAPRILETHHKDKRDAPSGTALALAAALRAARAPRFAGAEIPIDSRREGEVIGEHAVVFSGPGEELFLGHRAQDRGIFARGALAAALWLAPQPPGRYAMRDLLVGKTGT